MNTPPTNHQDWQEQYARMLALLFERNLGDFLLTALISDLQEAWLRAIGLWQADPERYAVIQEQWQTALARFNESVTGKLNNPLASMDHLKTLHGELEQCLRAMVEETPGITGDDRCRLRFGIRHLVHALAPEYWPQTNPEVLQTAAATNGTSFINGLQNFYQDISSSVVGLNVKTANTDDFILGETLASTPGEVVYENDLMQLIQYYPCSQEVWSEPLLIVPPWINKYYVLDLNPSDSFVQWALRQGHTVFMISWVNPDAGQRDLGLGDYLVRGCIQAVREVRTITATERLNLAGYCIGGMLATCAVAWLAAGGDNGISSLTLFNTMLDYSEPGDIGVFLSERMLAAVDSHVNDKGVLDGRIMRQAFTMLREDRMFWPYVVNNYLLGKAPQPNPVIYWNQDATNLPSRMLKEFLGDMYRDNALINDDDYMLAGRRMQLAQVELPVYALACRTDHIIPWRSAYRSVLPFAGEVDFVLADAGHVMGVINPPNRRQSGYWLVSGQDKNADADSWLEQAGRHEGSWWPHWHNWIAGLQPGKTSARFPGAAGATIIENAPGRYVKRMPEI